MRSLVIPVLALATLVPTQRQPTAPDPARLVGRWSGTGTFFSADVQQKVGSLPVAVEFTPDRSGTGRVGQATLRDVRVKPTRDMLEVRAKLVGFVAADPAVAKEHLIILVTTLSDSTIHAEFHLKTNLVFDPRMRQGRVVLTRMP